MALCTNRPEGFGPISHLYSHILTSCFIDTILIPLCTWLYLLSLLLLFDIFSLKRRRGPVDPYHTHPSNPSGKDAAIADTYEPTRATQKRTKTQTALLVLYALLVFAQILMCILEITRLSLARLGVGLLPFTFVSLIIAGALHLLASSVRRGRSLTFSTRRNVVGRTRRMWLVRWINLGLWTALAVCDAVKIVEEVKAGAGTRKGTKYPMSDEITDVGVMVGVYVALGVLEVVT